MWDKDGAIPCWNRIHIEKILQLIFSPHNRSGMVVPSKYNRKRFFAPEENMATEDFSTLIQPHPSSMMRIAAAFIRHADAEWLAQFATLQV
jgi:hypothetical protein